MHIRSEHQEKSTRIRMKHMFGHRSKPTSSTTASPPQPPFEPNPRQDEPAIDLLPLPISDTLVSSFRHLIPSEITDDEQYFNELNEVGGPISLKNLFNFTAPHWVNLHDEYAKKYMADELELCELLNQDAATDEGAEVDVDEMTGDILMG